MAVPQLSPEERQAALEKAKIARAKRAEVREKLKQGELTLEQVLDMRDDPIIGRMKVSALIETLPGYGKTKARSFPDSLSATRKHGFPFLQPLALLVRAK